MDILKVRMVLNGNIMSKLTGKAKEEFEKWYFKNHCKSNIKYKDLMPHDRAEVFGWFYKLPLSFQWGLYVDFFDSVEDKTEIRMLGEVSRGYKRYCSEFREDFTLHKSRIKARKEAIKKANEIYNEKHFVFPHDLDKQSTE